MTNTEKKQLLAEADNLPHGEKGLWLRRNRLWDISKFNSLAVFGIFVLLSANTLYYTFYIKQLIPAGDSWRFITNSLIPYYENGFRLELLWNDPIHASPLRILLLFLNADFFSLSFNIEKFIGVVFKILTALLLLIHVLRTLGVKDKLPLIIIVLILFSFSNEKQFSWSIMSTLYLTLFPIALYLLVQDKLIRAEDFSQRIYFKWIALAAFVLVVTKDEAIILFSASIVFLLFHSFVERKPINILYVATITFLAICIAPWVAAFQGTTFNFNGEIVNELHKFPENSINIVHTYAMSLFSGFVKPNIIIENFGKMPVIVGGYLVVVFQLVVLFGAIKWKAWKRTTVPIVLVFFASIYFVATVTKRYGEWHTPFMTVPDRYLIVYGFGAVGLIWLFSIAFKLGRKAHLILAVVFVVVLTNETYSTVHAWQRVDTINKYRYNISKNLIRFANGELARKDVGVAARLSIEDQVLFMKKHCLNIFKGSCEDIN